MPASLSLKNGQLVISIKETDEQVKRPIEDIGFVIIECPMIAISIPLLNEFANNNVGVVFCDDKQMPKSMLFPLDSNNTQGESYREQINITEPCRKQIWKQVIESKIKNQSKLLHKLAKDGNVLKPFYMNVKSGDTDNREGIAAKLYWSALLGKGFVRDRMGIPPNNFLNYGYSILRAATARALIGSGLLPAFGIFHRNRYNSFPLADDIMEPYRPYVDEIAYNLFVVERQTELNKNAKTALLHILFCDVRLDNVTRPLEVALTMTSASLLREIKGEKNNLIFPQFR